LTTSNIKGFLAADLPAWPLRHGRGSDVHDNYPAPNILVGRGNGKMKLGGQHLLLPERTPIANLHLTLLQRAGVERDKFDDSTNVISGV
jgi:hypothetical protein